MSAISQRRDGSHPSSPVNRYVIHPVTPPSSKSMHDEENVGKDIYVEAWLNKVVLPRGEEVAYGHGGEEKGDGDQDGNSRGFVGNYESSRHPAGSLRWRMVCGRDGNEDKGTERRDKVSRDGSRVCSMRRQPVGASNVFVYGETRSSGERVVGRHEPSQPMVNVQVVGMQQTRSCPGKDDGRSCHCRRDQRQHRGRTRLKTGVAPSILGHQRRTDSGNGMVEGRSSGSLSRANPYPPPQVSTHTCPHVSTEKHDRATSPSRPQLPTINGKPFHTYPEAVQVWILRDLQFRDAYQRYREEAIREAEREKDRWRWKEALLWFLGSGGVGAMTQALTGCHGGMASSAETGMQWLTRILGTGAITASSIPTWLRSALDELVDQKRAIETMAPTPPARWPEPNPMDVIKWIESKRDEWERVKTARGVRTRFEEGGEGRLGDMAGLMWALDGLRGAMTGKKRKPESWYQEVMVSGVQNAAMTPEGRNILGDGQLHSTPKTLPEVLLGIFKALF